MQTHLWILWVTALVAAVLAGCGGGSDPPAVVNPPTVDTGNAAIGAAKAVFPANAVNV